MKRKLIADVSKYINSLSLPFGKLAKYINKQGNFVDKITGQDLQEYLIKVVVNYFVTNDWYSWYSNQSYSYYTSGKDPVISDYTSLINELFSISSGELSGFGKTFTYRKLTISVSVHTYYDMMIHSCKKEAYNYTESRDRKEQNKLRSRYYKGK